MTPNSVSISTCTHTHTHTYTHTFAHAHVNTQIFMQTYTRLYTLQVYGTGGGNIMQVQYTAQTTNNMCFSANGSSIMGDLWTITELPAVGALYINDGGNDM